MSTPWYVYVIIAVIASLLLEVCNRFKIIKSKDLRYFLVIFASSFTCLVIYDLVIAHK